MRRSIVRHLVFLVMLLGITANSAWGQTDFPAAPPAMASGPASGLLPGPDATLPTDPVAVPAVQDKEEGPPRLLRELKLEYTNLSGVLQDNVTMRDVELSTTVALPWRLGVAPLLLTPAAAMHFWTQEGLPFDPRAQGIPSRLYDLSLDIGWKERLAPWFFVDLGVTPGLYTDFKAVDDSSFRLRGRSLGIIAFSEHWQLVTGVLYVNRNNVKLLPAGGVIWSPSADTRCALVFPAPKIQHRLTTFGQAMLWGYVAGEFGGGSWSFQRADGLPDSVDYSDGRVLMGLEWETAHGLKANLEAGLAVNRQMTFVSTAPDIDLPGAILLRAGLRY